MQENRVSIKIPAADVQKLFDAVDTFKTILSPYLVALSPEDRQTMPKMNDGTLPFVQKALDYATQNKEFVPAYVDVSELKVDVDATAILLQIERPLIQLIQNLDSTIMLSGSEAYMAALSYYNSVKQAAKMKVPGAEPIAKDLSARFTKTSAKVVKPDQPH